MTKFSATWRIVDSSQYTARRNYLERADAAADLDLRDFHTLDPWKYMRRCNVANDGTINAFYGDSDYVDNGSNGQVMTYLKKFYSQVTSGTQSGVPWINWALSNDQNDGLPVNPAFVANSVVKPYVLLGAFPASMGSDNRLESRAATASDLRRPYQAGATALAIGCIARTQTPLPANLLTSNCANGAEGGNLGYSFTGNNGGVVSASTDAFSGWPPFGKHSVKVVTTADQHSGFITYNEKNVLPIPGGTYTFSFYTYTPSDPTMKFELFIMVFDSSGTYLGVYGPGYAGVALGSGVNRYAYTVAFTNETPPATMFAVGLQTPWNQQYAGTYYIDGLQFEPYTAGRATLDPGGNPTAFHIGQWPYVEKRPGTGWGMMKGQTWAAVQLLSLVENATWDGAQMLGMFPGLMSFLWGFSSGYLLGDPAPTKLPYVGYTGSYGQQLGNQTGSVWRDMLEMYDAPPTTPGFPCMQSYRSIEMPWGGCFMVCDGMVFDTVGGTTHLFIADDQLNFIRDGYSDAGITLASGSWSEFVTNWTFGSSAKWFFLPGAVATSPTTILDQVQFDTANAFPSPLAFAGQTSNMMFGSRIGSMLDGPGTLFGTRLQYTPEEA
jgi:hypothetical protein